jgi:hypothetical protein
MDFQKWVQDVQYSQADIDNEEDDKIISFQ